MKPSHLNASYNLPQRMTNCRRRVKSRSAPSHGRTTEVRPERCWCTISHGETRSTTSQGGLKRPGRTPTPTWWVLGGVVVSSNMVGAWVACLERLKHDGSMSSAVKQEKVNSMERRNTYMDMGYVHVSASMPEGLGVLSSFS